jgi:hypothetical protein
LPPSCWARCSAELDVQRQHGRRSVDHHFVLGAILGCVLCAIIAPFQLDSSVGMSLLVGAVFGLVVYLFNFYVMTSAFPWFVDQRGWHTLVAPHLRDGHRYLLLEAGVARCISLDTCREILYRIHHVLMV